VSSTNDWSLWQIVCELHGASCHTVWYVYRSHFGKICSFVYLEAPF
jgi:hypothetical protein